MSNFIAEQEAVLGRTEGHSSSLTAWSEIHFLAEKRNNAAHFYSHLQQNWSNINDVRADWVYRASEVLIGEGKIFQNFVVITYKKL